MKNWLSIILVAVSVNAYAQSLGGVSGAEMWFKTLPVTTNLQGTYRWQDFSGDSIPLVLYRTGFGNVEYTHSRQYVRTFNFNPALSFTDGSSIYATLKRNNLAQMTIISVSAPGTSGYDKDQMLYTVSGRNGDNTLLSKDKLVHSNGASYLDYGSDTGEDLVYSSTDSVDAATFKENIIKVATLFKTNSPNTTIWDDAPNSTIAFGGTVSENTYDTSIFGNNAFTGHIPEFIVYGRLLTPSERRRVESYLAMKYAVTLSASYLDSEGNLIWDCGENTSHPYRVAAVGRDDAAGLLQPVSTTSYEETPNYAADNDSYHNADSYSLPSENRLLTIGHEYGNTPQNKTFLFISDDGAPLATVTADADSLWHVMQRTWLIKSNTQTTAQDSTRTRWTGNGMEITGKGWLDDIRQETASAGSYAVTPALTEGSGYVEFACPATHPAFTLGLAQKGEIACQYGFQISASGRVYKIENGALGNTSVAAVTSGETISLQKEGKNVFLRINGNGSNAMSITLPGAEAAEAASLVIRTLTADAALQLQDVRTGGIGNTGFQAELSYNLTSEKEFAPYRSKRTALLIDPSGEGNFDLSVDKAVWCSKPDMQRGKTIFHNILWDADGSGSDVFTFAYYDGLSLSATPTPSSCMGGNSANDGSILIGINIGTPTYSYILAVDTVAGRIVGDIVAQGTFSGDVHRIDSLAPGIYILSVTQQGGNDLQATFHSATDGQPGSSYSRSAAPYTDATIEWTVADTESDYWMGTDYGTSRIGVNNGFAVSGNKAYLVISGYASRDCLTIKEGDRLGITVTGNMVFWFLNGSEVYRTANRQQHPWHLCIQYGEGTTHISSLTIGGKPVASFDGHGNVVIDTPKACTVTMRVSVGSECDASLPNGAETISEPETVRREKHTVRLAESNDETFTVSAENAACSTTYIATLVQDVASPTSLMVFDAAGRLVLEKQMEGQLRKTTAFSVPSSGVYVVKAITNDGEHTKKIICK